MFFFSYVLILLSPFFVVNGVDVATLEKPLVDQKQLMILKQKLQEIGIDGSKCTPGQHHGLLCPRVCGFECFSFWIFCRFFYLFFSQTFGICSNLIFSYYWMQQKHWTTYYSSSFHHIIYFRFDSFGKLKSWTYWFIL